ncbi:MAG TPA: glycine oxidase ThiO [Acidimicrobiales bacterium]|nr:glycine oxidase ThiO [Acidimicrobiales bacterium]
MVLDAVFVGGGVIGLSGAWAAARAGLQVAVADPAPGRGASWVAAGLLAPVSEAHFGEEILVRLLVAAAGRWEAFAAALESASGRPVGYRRCGAVAVALDASDQAVLGQLLRFQHELGLEATRLSASECRALVPALAPGIRGGVDIPGDHQVDNRLLVEALSTACDRVGVRLVRTAVTAVERTRSGAAAGVRLRDGSGVRARAVVVAAGCESSLVAGVPAGVLPPIRPVKGHVVRLRGDPDRALLDRSVRGLVHGRPCYLVPRADGSLVVGATVEERGFDRSVQAGAVHALLDDARALVPGVDELELDECSAGLRPGSPDNGPFVGWTHMEGLAVAAGHYRNGILLAPITAEALAALLTGNQVPEALAPFAPDRAAALGAGR